MTIAAEHALSIIQTEIESFIYRYMNDGKISAGFMEKVLESILCEVRKLKNQDLDKLIIELNSKNPQVSVEKTEKFKTQPKRQEDKNGCLQSCAE